MWLSSASSVKASSSCHIYIVCNWLSVNTTWALLCLGAGKKAGYVEAADLKYSASQPDTKDDKDWPDEEWIVAQVVQCILATKSELKCLPLPMEYLYPWCGKPVLLV